MYNSDKLLSSDGQITFQKIYFVRILEAQKYIMFLNKSHKNVLNIYFPKYFTQNSLIFIVLNMSEKNILIFFS